MAKCHRFLTITKEIQILHSKYNGHSAGMMIYEKVIILILFSIFFGCSNPTEKFDGDYEPNIDETLKININLTPERIEADLQNFSVNRGVIQCGKDVIREWRVIRSRIDMEEN